MLRYCSGRVKANRKRKIQNETKPRRLCRKIARRRRVIAATMNGPGVEPSARSMIRVLSTVAERYTDGDRHAGATLSRR